MYKFAKDIKKGDKLEINRNGVGWGAVTNVVKCGSMVYITCDDGETEYLDKSRKIFAI